MTGATSLGWQIQFPILLSVAVLFLVFGLVSLWLFKRANDSYSLWGMGTGVGFIGSALNLAIFVGLLVPFAPQYWNWYSVKGTVQSVDAAVQAEGKYVTNNYTLKLSGHDDVYVTENPRITQYLNQPVELVCGIEWVPQGADAYNCNIRSVG